MAPGSRQKPIFTHFRAQARKWLQEAVRDQFLPISEPKPGNGPKKLPSVLHNTILYYKIQLCTNEYDSVLQNTILYYRIRLCTTEYDSVLQNMILYYRIQLNNSDTLNIRIPSSENFLFSVFEAVPGRKCFLGVEKNKFFLLREL